MKELKRQRILYAIDEISILLLTFISVFLSDTVERFATGINGEPELPFSWARVMVSGLMAVVVYATIHSKFKYNDRQKPSWWKRASIAVLQGIAWRTIIGWGG